MWTPFQFSSAAEHAHHHDNWRADQAGSDSRSSRIASVIRRYPLAIGAASLGVGALIAYRRHRSHGKHGARTAAGTITNGVADEPSHLRAVVSAVVSAAIVAATRQILYHVVAEANQRWVAPQ